MGEENKLVCPACGKINDSDDMVYCNILEGVEHPAYMIYAPTCECSHQFKESKNLVYGEGHKENVEWYGGIRISSHTRRYFVPIPRVD